MSRRSACDRRACTKSTRSPPARERSVGEAAPRARAAGRGPSGLNAAERAVARRWPRRRSRARRRWSALSPSATDGRALRSPRRRGAAGRGRAAQPPGERVQRGEVRGADPPPGSGEQADEVVAGGRVVQHAQARDEVRRSRARCSRPPMPSTWNGTPWSASAAVKAGRCFRARSSMRRRTAGCAASVELRREPRGDRVGLFGSVSVKTASTACRVARRATARAASTSTSEAAASGATIAFARVEHVVRVAPARRRARTERDRRRRRRSRGGSPSRFAAARAAPSVDRLVRVADRHHGGARRRAGRASGSARPRCPGTRRAARRGTGARRSATTRGPTRHDRRGRARPGRRTRRAPRSPACASRNVSTRRQQQRGRRRRRPAGSTPPCRRACRAGSASRAGRTRAPAPAAASGRPRCSPRPWRARARAAVMRSTLEVEAGERSSRDATTTRRASCHADGSPSTTPSDSRPTSSALSRKIAVREGVVGGDRRRVEGVVAPASPTCREPARCARGCARRARTRPCG